MKSFASSELENGHAALILVRRKLVIAGLVTYTAFCMGRGVDKVPPNHSETIILHIMTFSVLAIKLD